MKASSAGGKPVKYGVLFDAQRQYMRRRRLRATELPTTHLLWLAREWCVNCTFDGGENSVAISAVLDAAAERGSDEALWMQGVVQQWGRKDRSDDKEWLCRLLERDSSPWAHYTLARIRMCRDKVFSAVALLRAAVAAGCVHANAPLAELLLEFRGREAEARPLIERAAALNDGHALWALARKDGCTEAAKLGLMIRGAEQGDPRCMANLSALAPTPAEVRIWLLRPCLTLSAARRASGAVPRLPRRVLRQPRVYLVVPA